MVSCAGFDAGYSLLEEHYCRFDISVVDAEEVEFVAMADMADVVVAGLDRPAEEVDVGVEVEIEVEIGVEIEVEVDVVDDADSLANSRIH